MAGIMKSATANSVERLLDIGLVDTYFVRVETADGVMVGVYVTMPAAKRGESTKRTPIADPEIVIGEDKPASLDGVLEAAVSALLDNEYDAFCVAPHKGKPGMFRVWLFWNMAHGFGQKTLTRGVYCRDMIWNDADKARRWTLRNIGMMPERPDLLR